MEEEKTQVTLETAFEKLEDIIGHLEQPGVTLEDSFRLYEDGMHLIKQCNEKIDSVEKKVLELSDDMSTKEFE